MADYAWSDSPNEVHLGIDQGDYSPPTKSGGSMDPATAGLIGAGIMTAGNMVSTHMTNKSNKAMQTETNKKNEDLWHKQNAYNHPVNQIARLKKAGLNPNLIYHSATGASGIAGPAPQMKSPKYHAPKMHIDFNAYAHARHQHALAENAIKQGKNIPFEGELTKSQTSYTDAQNMLIAQKVNLVEQQTSFITAQISELLHNLHATPSWMSTKDNSKYAFAGRTGLGIWDNWIKPIGRGIKKQFLKERSKIKGLYK